MLWKLEDNRNTHVVDSVVIDNGSRHVVDNGNRHMVDNGNGHEH